MGALCEKCFGVKQEGEDKINPMKSSSYGSTSSTMVSHTPSGMSVRPRVTSNPPTDEIKPIELSRTTVDKIDKRFKEHSDLFNRLLDSHRLLQEKYLEFINKKNESFFLSHSDVSNVIQSIKAEAGNHVSLERRHKYRMEIVTKEGVSISQTAAIKIKIFNELNQICYDLITKLPVLKQDVVNMTTTEEDQFKRDVLVQSWSEEDEKLSTLKILMNNISEFRKLPPNCDKMQTTAKELFDMILKASSVLVS